MTNQEINQERRRFLVLATAGAAGVGALGVATPFVASFFPSEKAKAAGAPIDIDVSKIEAGQLVTAEWRGKPIWVLNRTEQQLKDLPSLNAELVDPSSTAADQQPEYCQNELRSGWPSVFVPTWVARPLSVPTSLLPIWVRTGRAVSSAPATAPNSTWPAACSKACRHRPIW